MLNLTSWFFCLIDQEERSRSVEAFRRGEKDVLVATDVASKGLDFNEIQHVINYDMPDDVENYGKLYGLAAVCSFKFITSIV